MSKETQYKPSEVYNILKKTVEANDKLISLGKMPISVSVMGEKGIGKSTVQKDLVKDMGRQFVKVSLAQMTEPSELIGYFVKEFEMINADKETKWVFESLLTLELANGYTVTGTARTTPCPPSWIVGIQNGAIIVLDDYSRSNSLFSQAIMELINEQEMIGWDLKSKGVQIFLNENPDDGNYNVSSQDSAQMDRAARIHMKWDAQDWAARAEKLGTDERLTNFVLWAPELLKAEKKDGIPDSNGVSPRMMDKFFGLVSTIDDFERHLDQITLFGDMTVGKTVTSHLINFINKKLDKLPSIEQMIKHDKLVDAKKALTDCCGDCEKNPENWKLATAAILTTRMYNYMRFNHDNISKDNIKQYLELLLHSSFGVDHKYLMVKQTVGLSNTFQQVLAGDPRFLKYMVK